MHSHEVRAEQGYNWKLLGKSLYHVQFLSEAVSSPHGTKALRLTLKQNFRKRAIVQGSEASPEEQRMFQC